MSRKDEKAGILGWTLFIIYLVILVWIILFKSVFSWDDLPHMRSINLIPYGQSMITNGKISVSELWQNVVAFVPLGIYLGMIGSKGRIWKKIVIAALVSLILEVLQYILAVGASDITDIINNTIGGVIGIIIYSVLYFIFGRRTNKVLRRIALICTILIVAFLIVLIIANL